MSGQVAPAAVPAYVRAGSAMHMHMCVHACMCMFTYAGSASRSTAAKPSARDGPLGVGMGTYIYI